MSDENTQVEEQTEETPVPAPETASTAPASPEASSEAAPAAPAEKAEEPEVEMVQCMISKQRVPLSETIELERKKGEVLRIHQRYKKFE